jgi:threonine dehydratase
MCTHVHQVDPSSRVSLRDVEDARRRLGSVLPRTPAYQATDRRALLKLENLQVTGAYKVRGAFNAVAAQLERGDLRPVIAASAGNHGKGVAWAARYFGLAAVVVVPVGAPAAKVEGARALGAEVIERGASFDECFVIASELAGDRGYRLIHAFDDPEVVAGQGTIGLELLPLDPDVVVVPIGGGGLAAGVGLVLAPRGIRVVGAQVEGVDAMKRALQGRHEDRPLPPTMADGLVVREPGKLTRSICARVLDDIVTVSEDEVRRTVVELASRDKLIVEGAGAVAVAALTKVEGKRRVAVVSGGNIDLDVLAGLRGLQGVGLPASSAGT